MKIKLRISILLFAILFQVVSCSNEKVIPYDDLRLKLSKIREADQSIRESYLSATPKEIPAIIKSMDSIDKANKKDVLNILENYGWIKQSKIGEDAADALFLVVQHSDLKTMKKYFPQLKDLANKHEAKKTYAAMMEDRILMDEGEKQIYGTQAVSGLRETKELIVIWPILDPKNVNKRRTKMGFTTAVEENALRLNALYNPKETLPKKQN
ncbi:DUF6624 domain-containing protein [Pedobacter cryophilus]|uniref:Lipoprotein n=1 Tax=Pedobacter cryophilus TaxID=2571271 RepID=A0A4U1BU80_9SPHI|nr:DUF6624 domain-containing protein [Pedobacter cryophilus]TKB95163.1 hypothetical protein FA046_17055 [Pedobacter cryophilus]